jgi:hypothetical protein
MGGAGERKQEQDARKSTGYGADELRVIRL